MLLEPIKGEITLKTGKDYDVFCLDTNGQRTGSPEKTVNADGSVTIKLTAENKKQIFIPKGFAHGFLTLTDDVEIMYKCDELYSPECDGGIRFDDPEIGVEWGVENPILSEKDKNAPYLKDIKLDF